MYILDSIDAKYYYGRLSSTVLTKSNRANYGNVDLPTLWEWQRLENDINNIQKQIAELEAMEKNNKYPIRSYVRAKNEVERILTEMEKKILWLTLKA